MRMSYALATAICLLFTISCRTSSGWLATGNSPPEPSVQKTRQFQIIVKFRDKSLDPSRIDFVQNLARYADAALVYLRPMSGDAHVFRVENISDSAQLSKVIRRLSERPDVLYAEQDLVMQHQKGQ